jgi:hypothetical protein
MSSTTTPKTADQHAIESTVADLKQRATAATAVQAEVVEKAMKTAKDVSAFNQNSLAAFTEASQILATGSQDLFRQMVASSQAAFAEALAGFRALAATKSLKERVELQASLTRASATRAVTEASCFALASIELTEKASAPLTARAVLAAESFATPKP